MFLKPTPPRVTRRSRLDNWFLLLLRCLAFALIALAFARPYFQEATSAANAATERLRTVVLVDTSASMRREPLWTRALAEARTALEEPSDELALMAFDVQPRLLFGFQQWTGTPSGQRSSFGWGLLQSQSPGWSGTQLGRAMVRAVELLEEGTDLPTRRRIVVISDLAEGAGLDGLQGFDWPKGVEVRLVPIGPDRPGNAGLQPIADTGTSPGPATSAKVRLHNTADAKTDRFQLRLDGSADPLEAYVPAGQSRVATVSLTNTVAATNGAGWRLRLTGDEQGFDNDLFLQPQPQETVRVVYLGNDEAKDSSGQLYYLLRAFPESRLRRVEVEARRLDLPLDPAGLAEAAMVVVGGELDESQLRGVKALLEGGQTVLCPLASPGQAAQWGMLLGGTALPAEEHAGRYGLLGQIDFQHPLFAPFADARFSDFTGIHFWKFRRVDLSAVPSANVVARFDTGEPALAQIAAGKGTLLLLGSTWRPSDSQLALSSKFVPLLGGMLELGRAHAPLATQFTVDDPVPLPANVSGGERVVVGPEGRRVVLPREATQFAETTVPGFYRVEGLDRPYRFAVNLSPEESRTAPLGADVLPNLGVPVKSVPVPGVQTGAEARQATLAALELESRQKLWRWLILGALGIIVLETWVAGRLSRAAA